MRRATLITMAVVLAAVLAGLLFLRRTAPSALRQEQRQRERTVAENLASARREYASVQMAAAGGVDSVESVRSLLDSMELRGVGVVGQERARLLLDQLAEFIYYRFLQDDPGQYRRWRSSRGYTQRSLEELIREEGVGRSYEAFAGRELLPDASFDTAFDEIWALTRSARRGAGRVVAIADEGKGLVTVFGDVTRQDPFGWASVEGQMSAGVWNAGAGYSSPVWWVRPPVVEMVRARNSGVAYARVGLLVDLANGVRRPLMPLWVWDDAAGDWRLFGLAQTAASGDDGVLLII